MKKMLIDTIRSVPIAGKTYEEYVEALADKMMAFCVEQASFDEMTIYILDHYAKQKASEIFQEIEKLKHTKFDWSDVVDWDGIAELKKKYTEGGK